MILEAGLRRPWPGVRVSLLRLGPPVSVKAGGCRKGRHCSGEPGPSTVAPCFSQRPGLLVWTFRLRSSFLPSRPGFPLFTADSRPLPGVCSPGPSVRGSVRLCAKTHSSAWACRTAALTPRAVLCLPRRPAAAQTPPAPWSSFSAPAGFPTRGLSKCRDFFSIAACRGWCPLPVFFSFSSFCLTQLCGDFSCAFRRLLASVQLVICENSSTDVLLMYLWGRSKLFSPILPYFIFFRLEFPNNADIKDTSSFALSSLWNNILWQRLSLVRLLIVLRY